MIVVTGGAGFIGSAMVWKLNSAGIEDILIVDELGESEKWKNLVKRRFADYLHKEAFLKMALEDDVPFPVTAVIHMGACSSTTERDAEYLMRNNYRYSRALAAWAVKNNVRFIYASSAATYGDGSRGFSDDDAVTPTLQPINMYGYSKQLFDVWLLKNGLEKKTVGIKFFNVFGPDEYHKEEMRSVIHKAFGQIRETGEVRLFNSYKPEYPDGGQMRDFVYVKDCVEVLWWICQHPEVAGIFNLGTGKARTWNDLVKAVFSAMGKEAKIEYIEMPEDLRDQYQYFTEAPMQKLRAAGCTHTFRPLEDAIRDYVVKHLQQKDPYL
jgi:ADP-L-glycero-D-manno-heptose 6-epimerase